MKKTNDQMLVIFGASGDLTARKLIPALFNLYLAKQLPENFAVLGVSRSNLSDAAFRDKVVFKSDYLKEKFKKQKDSDIQAFAEKLYYEDLGDSESDLTSDLTADLTGDLTGDVTVDLTESPAAS